MLQIKKTLIYFINKIVIIYKNIKVFLFIAVNSSKCYYYCGDNTIPYIGAHQNHVRLAWTMNGYCLFVIIFLNSSKLTLPSPSESTDLIIPTQSSTAQCSPRRLRILWSSAAEIKPSPFSS